MTPEVWARLLIEAREQTFPSQGAVGDLSLPSGRFVRARIVGPLIRLVEVHLTSSLFLPVLVPTHPQRTRVGSTLAAKPISLKSRLLRGRVVLVLTLRSGILSL